MSSRILLISTNRNTKPDGVFPLGLAYVNAALRRDGHDTRWFDYNFESQPLATVLKEYRPQFVGVSVRNIDDVLIRKRETFFDDLETIPETVRKVNPCPVVLGGSGYSIFPERLLQQTGADYGIQGEGEHSFPTLISKLTHDEDVRTIPGLVYRRGQKIISNSQQPSSGVVGLETSDRPEHLVGQYLKSGGILNLQTQRGCSQNCCYCTYPLIEGRGRRRRPPETVAEEMAQLVAQGVKYLFIVDSVFNSSPQHVVEICEAIIRRNLKIRWSCFLRPQGLTPALMQIMIRAGLTHIEFGSDSFCDSVLEAYGKRLTFDDIRQSSELAWRHKLDYCHFLICGGPGETKDTLQTTFENSLSLDDAVIMAMVGMRIYPETALHGRAICSGQLSANTDLLVPAYFLAAGLSEAQVFASLQEFSSPSANWIIGDPPSSYLRIVERLRSRGVSGPLWSYFSTIQRLWPTATDKASSV